MKRFIIRTLLFSILPIVITVCINLWVDPAAIFKYNIEKEIAQYLLDGYNVTGVSNYNERLVQKNIIENKTSNLPTDIVLGSSRGMLIDKRLSQNPQSFFNHSMSGGSLEDFLCIYDLYLQQKATPSFIIIELSPWLLNKNNSISLWKTLQQNYEEMQDILNSHKSINILPSHTSTYFEIFSPSYFQESFKKLISQDTIGHPTATLIKDSINGAKLTDGSVIYNQAYNQIDSIALSSLQSENLRRFLNWGGFYRFNALSQAHKDTFIRFIQYLKQKNTNIVFFLAPFHPLVYEELKKMYPVDEAEKFFYQIAKDLDIKITGSYNPEKYNLSLYDFHDGIHPRKSVYQKLLWNK